MICRKNLNYSFIRIAAVSKSRLFFTFSVRLNITAESWTFFSKIAELLLLLYNAPRYIAVLANVQSAKQGYSFLWIRVFLSRSHPFLYQFFLAIKTTIVANQTEWFLPVETIAYITYFLTGNYDSTVKR